jgi:hypothetical protein
MLIGTPSDAEAFAESNATAVTVCAPTGKLPMFTVSVQPLFRKS